MTEKRGRIAHVLAEARASLLEPSRPLTPDGLNKRVTSLNMPSYEAMMAWNQDADKRLISEINAELQTSRVNHLYYDEDAHEAPMYIKENLAAAPSSPSSSPSSSPKRTYPEFDGTSPPGAKISPVLSMLDKCASEVRRRASRAAVVDEIQNIGAVVDRFAKQVGSGALFDTSPDPMHIIYTTGHVFTQSLLGIADDDTIDAVNTKCLACRHALRVQLALLVSDRMSSHHEEIISGIHHATCLLYGVHQEVQDMRKDTEEMPAVGEGGPITVNDDHLHEAVDSLLAFLDVLWQRLPGDLERELLLLRKAKSGAAVRDILTHLLTSAGYAASVLREYSSREVNRRRLLMLGVVTTVTNGLDTVGKHAGAFTEQLVEKERAQKPAIMNIFRADMAAGADAGEEAAKTNKARARIMDLLCTLSIQAVTTLRNFSMEASGRKELVKQRSICALCQLMPPFMKSPELVLSCARALAKLSLSEAFRQQINSKIVYSSCITEILEREGALALPRLRSLMSSTSTGTSSSKVEDWPQWYSLSLLSRICFVLGNLTTSNAESRVRVVHQGKGLTALITLVQYCNLTLVEFSKQDFTLFDEAVQERELELCDVGVKLLRLLANVSIDREVGRDLAGREEVLSAMRSVLRVAIVAEGSMSNEDPATGSRDVYTMKRGALYEELLLNALAVMTNVSYHMFAGTVQDSSEFDNILVGTMDCVGACLFYDNGEILMEATRAMGNLTRCRVVAAYTAQKGYADALVVLLSHNNFDIQTASAGALVNISTSKADPNSCRFLRDMNSTVDTFVGVLRRASFNYFRLSILVCRTLANLLLDTESKVGGDSSDKRASGLAKGLTVDEIPSLQALRDTLDELQESTVELQEEAKAAGAEDHREELKLYAAFLDVSTPILGSL